MMLSFNRKKRVWVFRYGEDVYHFKTYAEALKFAAAYEWALGRAKH